ncbi:putative endopeptidase p60 precursor [Clostridium homopropionicum DSM 5847]|uniref:Putative endopeptidase p60 n=1 Tax=Clostridium homopropionicum DSM 5847 TaxID=1121318 RepID=A0A0L6ZE16_9CLOT|nr:C40 family peptidase [Clostridium homopropionicum]KOA21216.1 putative endopeptidase p60 precursor [Clostridium homopropionicum DSM 5847]SFG27631.1 Cell wall-associated hydrolase, NlpC family [Clostridium homopropionicum]
MKRILMKKLLRCFILVFILAISLHKPVLADPPAEQRGNQRFEIEQNIEKLDMQIEEVMGKIKENNDKIARIQENKKSTEAEFEKAEEEVRNEQELYNERIRVMYMNGSVGYLDVILGAENLSDLFQKIEAVKKITQLDKELVQELKEKQEYLKSKRDELNKQQDELVELNKENNEKLNNLKTKKNEQKNLIAEAERQDRLNAASFEASQSQVDKTLQGIMSNKKASEAKVRLSRGGTGVSSSEIIAYASKFLGTPYLWGGTTPEGFDCSGFTQYVYKHFGISLGRTTKDQIYDGVGVSRDQLQPGDLVFYGKGGVPSHMGIYIGNGMYIHAPRTGEVIKISSYGRADYITARRIIR